MNKLLTFIAVTLILSLNVISPTLLAATASIGSKKQFGTIQTIVLHGTHQQMGDQYGRSFKKELHEALMIIKNYYINQHGVSYSQLQAQANLFYERFPRTYQKLIEGVAKGAEITLNDAKILNAMETLGVLLNHPHVAQCAFLALPSIKTKSHALLIGRNYDFPAPYDQLAKYLTVTVLQEDNAVPTAFISIVGEMYCPTCVNAKGLFMELNNGMPSGGYQTTQTKESLLIKMLQIMQHASTLQDMQHQLEGLQADYSLIINIADKQHVQSYEYSSTLGMKVNEPKSYEIYASTNFYLNPAWKNTPKPTDATTWLGVTRRTNLLRLSRLSNQVDVSNLKTLMDKTLANGGAVVENCATCSSTIYQIIFDPQELNLYIKIVNQNKPWNTIPLKLIFPHNIKPS